MLEVVSIHRRLLEQDLAARNVDFELHGDPPPKLGEIAFTRSGDAWVCSVSESSRDELYALGDHVVISGAVQTTGYATPEFVNWFRHYVPEAQGGKIPNPTELQLPPEPGDLTREHQVSAMSRAQVQELASAYGLRANGPTADIIRRVLAFERGQPLGPEDRPKAPRRSRKRRSKDKPRKLRPKTLKVYTPPKGRASVPIPRIIAELERIPDIRALFEDYGAHRLKIAFAKMMSLWGGANDSRLSRSLATGVVPGMVVSVAKKHHWRSRDGSEREWGMCEYTVRCEPGGGFTLVGFKGGRPDIHELAERETYFLNARSLFRVLTGHAKHGMTFSRFFRTLTAEEEGRVSFEGTGSHLTPVSQDLPRD